MGSSASRGNGWIAPPPSSVSLQNLCDGWERGESNGVSTDQPPPTGPSGVMLGPVEGAGENEERSAVEKGLEDGFRHNDTAPITLKHRLHEKSPLQHVQAVETNVEGHRNDDCSDLDRGSETEKRDLILNSCRRFVSHDIGQGFTGLQLLLSPFATPKHVFTRLTRGGVPICKSLPAVFHKTSFEVTGLAIAEMLEKQPEWIVDGVDVEEPGSPLFDPSILATFERALEITSDDSWLSSDLSNASSRNLFSSPELCSDGESPEWPKPSEPQDNQVGFITSQSMREEMRGEQVADTTNKNNGYPKGGASECFNNEWTKIDYLEHFEFKSPPGCEGKTVLYFTSLRGIRKTYEDCCNVRMILKGFGVQVDERDVWMHSKFRQELTNIMGDTLSVPRLFIKGRYIGGAEDVQHLNEDGVLAKLLKGLPTEWNDMCDLCGGVRFILCNTCGGSCKTVSSDEVIARCLDCNENGLSMCPSCGWQ